MDGRSRPAPPDIRGRDLIARCLLAAAVAALLYLPTIQFAFTYDDASVVARHPQVVNEDWRAIAVSPYHVGPDVRVQTGAYRPLTIASLAANHAISGLSPWSYHLANVVLHALAAALVVMLGAALGLGLDAALIGALAFAVHPVHVEAVANVAGRAELLSASLALAALVAVLSARFVTAALVLTAALFAKENVVTILGVVVLWEALRARGPKRSLTAFAAASIPVAVYLAARWAVLGRLGLAPGSVTAIENPSIGLPLVSHAATVLSVFARALSLLVTPVRLSPDYGFAEIAPSVSFAAPGPLVGALLLAGLVAGVVWCARRAPTIAMLLGATLVTYAIVSNAFVPIGTILGDRLLYLPSAFACLLFGLAASAALRFGRVVRALCTGIILLALAARSLTYAAVWRNDTALFEYAARVAPDSVRALGGWGEILGEQGRLDEARAVLDRAVALAPDFIPNLLNRGAAALAAGDTAAAERDARHVLALDPDNAMAKLQLEAAAH